MIPRGSRVASLARRRVLLRSPAVAPRWIQSTSTIADQKPYYITTPIFYVNAAPHIGHLYTSVLADVIKRWQELRGRKALLCTGTDEYGMKIQQAAQRAGTEPKVFCDSGAATFKKLADDAEVGYDRFIRTTDSDHREAVEHFWRVLRERGYIDLKNHSGWYSVSDEAFYPDSAVEKIIHPPTGQPIVVSKETGKTVEWASEENYHFKLSEMAPRLLDFYAANPTFLLPHQRYDALVKEVSSGLQDLSISRPRERLNWGIPVPGDDSQSVYVWLDALVNYLTFTGYPSTAPGAATAWPADLQIIGKDIIRFHCIYWPAFLLAVGLPPPKQVLSHAHWTMSHRKMSKSVGNVVDPFHAMERWGVETMRFYLCLDGGIQQDGDYSNQAVEDRYDKFLRAQLGSLLTRVCSKKYSVHRSLVAQSQGVKVQLDDDMAALHSRLSGLLDGYRERVADKMDAFDLSGGIREVLDVVAETHKYIHAAALWEDRKEGVRAYMLYPAAEALRISGILLQPVMPTKMRRLLDLLRVEEGRRRWEDAVVGGDYGYGKGTEGLKEQVFRPFPFTPDKVEKR